MWLSRRIGTSCGKKTKHPAAVPLPSVLLRVVVKNQPLSDTPQDLIREASRIYIFPLLVFLFPLSSFTHHYVSYVPMWYKNYTPTDVP